MDLHYDQYKAPLTVHIFVGDRSEESGRALLMKLAGRLADGKALFTSDELKVYAAVLKELYLGVAVYDFAGR